MNSRQRHRDVPPAPAPDPELVRRLLLAVRTKLRSAASERIAAQMQRTYGEKVQCLGISAAQVHHIGLDMVRQMRTGGLALSLEVADPLWRSGVLEEGLAGAQIVGAMGRHIGGGDFERFEQWAGALTNRATADALALQLVSRAVAARPSLVNRLRDWTQSSRPELRRTAVMSFVPLVREGRFLTDAFSVIERVMQDLDPQVQEGAGIVLMEASRLQADRIFGFLQQWQGKSPAQLLTRAAAKLSASQRSQLLGAAPSGPGAE